MTTPAAPDATPAIESARHLTGDLRLTADVAVVGSGAGGAMAAHELARRGARVVVLEEGPGLEPSQMRQLEDEMLPLLYQERGGRSTEDLMIRVLGGRNVGGSTVHNTCLCRRAPPELLDLWSREHAVSGATARDLEPAYASVEEELSVSVIEAERRNRNNALLALGVARLGWRGGPLSHNRIGCQGSGFCELGCPFDAKQNAARVLLPRALRQGARVLADVRVVRVIHRGGRVRGVSGVALDARGQRCASVEVDAAAVVLAGSAIGSAVVAGRSGLPDPHRTLGDGLRLHPGVAVAGWFDEPVDAHRGIPQSYECTEWLDPSPGSERRAWITTVFAHPVGAAAMLPGFGADHRRWMLRYRHLAALTAMVHDESSGHVGVRPDGRARIDYAMSPSDRHQLMIGVRAAARLLLAAGAREVLVPCSPPIVLVDPAQVERMPDAAADPRAIAVTSVHPLGTLRLGDDPRRAVVTSAGEHHQMEGLFVLDGSLFPTSLGVPPQLSIYAFARHLAPRVLDRLGA